MNESQDNQDKNDKDKNKIPAADIKNDSPIIPTKLDFNKAKPVPKAVANSLAEKNVTESAEPKITDQAKKSHKNKHSLNLYLVKSPITTEDREIDWTKKTYITLYCQMESYANSTKKDAARYSTEVIEQFFNIFNAYKKSQRNSAVIDLNSKLNLMTILSLKNHFSYEYLYLLKFKFRISLINNVLMI